MKLNRIIQAIGLGSTLVMMVFVSVVRAADDVSFNAHPDAIESWLTDWSDANVRTTGGRFVLHHFIDRIYVVTSPLEWQPDNPDSGIEPIVVPKGFVTDFASVPRLFWAAYPPEGAYGFPALFHDYLYWTQPMRREDADRIFKIMMDEFDVGKISTATIHGVVRTAGGFAWRKNRKDCEGGERRILVRLPVDQPNTKWKDWKMESDVFGDPICPLP